MKHFEINPWNQLDSLVEPRYFSLKELMTTSVNKPNFPMTFTYVANLRALADILDTFREELGHPIFVSSGYRTPEVNDAVGGVPNSLHLRGRAADIWTSELQFENLVDVINRHRRELTEFIVNRYKGYIHIAI